MSGGGQSTTSVNGLNSLAAPYSQQNLGAMSQLAQTGQSPDASMPVAPLSSLQQQGLSSIGSVNPTSIGAANSGLSSILGGQYMGAGSSQMSAASPMIGQEASGSLMNPNSNPYLSSMYNLGLQGIQNNQDSQFGAAGRNILASSPVQTDQASTLASNLLGGQYDANLQATQNAQGLASSNYNTGVGAINSAAGFAPGVTAGQYMPGQAQLQAGGTQQQQQQNVLNAPYNTVSWYSGLLNGGLSPYASNTGSTSNNPSTLSTIGGILSLL